MIELHPFEAQVEALCEGKDFRWALKGKVPEEPGTVSIPGNHVRLYHYTRVTAAGDIGSYKAAENLRKQGIKLAHARGSRFGEPNQIWSSTRKPGNNKIYVEFHVAKDDPRIGGSVTKVTPGGDLTFMGSDGIKPKDIIAVHEPWHRRYRYIRDRGEMLQKVRDGTFDRMTDMDEYGPAVLRLKHEMGIKESAFERQVTALFEAKDYRWALKGKMPKEQGTVRIPSNHVRLYHYTRMKDYSDEGKYKAAESLRKGGLQLGKAKGQSYGEPNQIWASTRVPQEGHVYAEFSVAMDDPRISFGSNSHMNASQYQKSGQDMTFWQDIKPKDIIAVHEPWHARYRYLSTNKSLLADVRAGEMEYLSDLAEYAPALVRTKHDLGIKESILEYTSSVTRAKTAKRRADPEKQRQGRLAARSPRKALGQRRGQRQASHRQSQAETAVLVFCEMSADYRGNHTAPNKSFGAPLHDLSDFYPDDIYSANGPRYYGDGGGNSRDRKSIMIMRTRRGKPNAPVTIYRAVPLHAGDEINIGDWVSINREYAEGHGESVLRGDYKIIEKTVKAREIYTHADSVHEWGYNP